MDSGTILIASFMIFSIGRTTVSGLNFDPSFFLHIVKGSKARFLLPLLIEIFVACRCFSDLWGFSVFLVLKNGRYLSQDRNDYPCSMGLHPSLNVVGYY
jgi:hypothetical protein